MPNLGDEDQPVFWKCTECGKELYSEHAAQSHETTHPEHHCELMEDF